MISGGRCVCKEGYTKNSCGVCALSCASGQFPFQGGCGICPLNTIYKPEINGCDCPNGYYKDAYGVCQELVLKPIDCPAGQYFDKTNGCVACPGSCKTCTSATKCTSCATAGYEPNSVGKCSPKCGDGLIIGTETCDSGNKYTAGCINCQIQQGYTCSGQPSVCRSNQPPIVKPPVVDPPVVDPPIVSPPISTKPHLYQHGAANVNTNNVFVTLKTNPSFTFKDQNEQQNFIKSSFPSGPKPTVYCSQRVNP